MDIAVMPNSNTFGSPVKLFEYMAMRRAIVAPRLGPEVRPDDLAKAQVAERRADEHRAGD
jgi:hypothetical protein